MDTALHSPAVVSHSPSFTMCLSPAALLLLSTVRYSLAFCRCFITCLDILRCHHQLYVVSHSPHCGMPVCPLLRCCCFLPSVAVLRSVHAYSRVSTWSARTPLYISYCCVVLSGHVLNRSRTCECAVSVRAQRRGRSFITSKCPTSLLAV